MGNHTNRTIVRGSSAHGGSFRTDPWVISPRVLEGLRKHLNATILQQEEMVNTIVDTLLARIYREPDEDRPMASFLITGKSGTGKTSIFQEIAKYLQMHDEYRPGNISDHIISLDGYHAAELGSVVGGWWSNGWGHEGNKPSKMEEIDETIRSRDGLRRNLLCLDEADKITISPWNSIQDWLGRIWQFIERARIEPKRPEGTMVDKQNWIIFVTTNFFTQDVSATGRNIGFLTSEERKSAQELERIANETDSDEVRDKLAKFLPNSLINRFDAVIVTKDIVNGNIRRESALKELQNIQKWVSDWYKSSSWRIVDMSDLFDEEEFVNEILEKANYQGGIRAIKHYARNVIKPKVIKELLRVHPLPDEKECIRPGITIPEECTVGIEDLMEQFEEIPF